MPQGAKDGGVAMTGSTVCHKEPRMAVWRGSKTIRCKPVHEYGKITSY